MLILALSGVLFAIALPRLAVILDAIEVRTAASHIAAAHQRARMMAVTKGQVLVLSVQQDTVTIHRRGEDPLLWSESGPAAEGVTLDGARQFTFSPEGLTFGLSNATLRLSRNSATRAVVVSRLGRVRITR